MSRRYVVDFRCSTIAGYAMWEEEYPTLTEAREQAEQRVDDGEADDASIEHGTVAEHYTELGWSVL